MHWSYLDGKNEKHGLCYVCLHCDYEGLLPWSVPRKSQELLPKQLPTPTNPYNSLTSAVDPYCSGKMAAPMALVELRWR